MNLVPRPMLLWLILRLKPPIHNQLILFVPIPTNMKTDCGYMLPPPPPPVETNHTMLWLSQLFKTILQALP